MMHLNFVLAALFVAGAAAAPLNTTLPTVTSTSEVVKLPAQSTLTSVTVPTVPTSAPDVKAAALPTTSVGSVPSQTFPSISPDDVKVQTISTSIIGRDVLAETSILSTSVATDDVKIQTVPNPTGAVTISTDIPTTSLVARVVPSSVYQHNSRAVGETSVLSSIAPQSSQLNAFAAEAPTTAPALSTGTLAAPTSLDTPAVDFAAVSVTSSIASLPTSTSVAAPSVIPRHESNLEVEVEPEVHSGEHGVDAEVEVEPEAQLGDFEAELEVEPEVHAGHDGVEAELELESRDDIDTECAEGEVHVAADAHAHTNARRGFVPALHTTVDVVRPGATAIPPLGRF